MKLSIIVCVYNTDKAMLEECLRSMTASTRAHPYIATSKPVEYEILIIDDGSKCDYTKLVAKYGAKLTKTENQGIFRARRLGVSLATGDYVTFVDSDDTVTANYHLPMLLEAEGSGADIVLNDWAFNSSSYYYYCTKDRTIATDINAEGGAVLEAFLSRGGREHSWYVLWNKVFRKKIISDATEAVAKATSYIRRYNYAEDALMNFFAFAEAKKLRNVHTGYYLYRIHDRQSVTVTSEARLGEQIKLMSLTLDTMAAELVRRERGGLIRYVNEWRGLICRSHYSHARRSHYVALYPYIREKYGINKLKMSTYRDEACYLYNTPIPLNLKEIDSILLEVWIRGVLPTITHNKCAYIQSFIDYMKKISIEVGDDEIHIDVKRISWRSNLRFNHTLLRIARRLFPKGSKIRKFIKSRL
ncbi:MAG: glycosyltransferase family 2 protein [Clostridia bacterium]|nr:glycosyltransferase family 2 protein [Clostridia bacterium]